MTTSSSSWPEITPGRTRPRLNFPMAWAFTVTPLGQCGRVLHLTELIGFRNRTNVVLDWGWNYLTHHQGAGLMQCEGMGGSSAP